MLLILKIWLFLYMICILLKTSINPTKYFDDWSGTIVSNDVFNLVIGCLVIFSPVT